MKIASACIGRCALACVLRRSVRTSPLGEPLPEDGAKRGSP